MHSKMVLVRVQGFNGQGFSKGLGLGFSLGSKPALVRMLCKLGLFRV